MSVQMAPTKPKPLIHFADKKAKPICGAALQGEYPNWNIRGDTDKVTCQKCLNLLPTASE
jgi:hypothetical protein